MTELPVRPKVGDADDPSQARPPLRPTWLYPVLAFGVIATHIVFFASGVYWPDPQYADLASINAELVPEGDSLEAGELAPEGEALDVSTMRESEAEDSLPVPSEDMKESETAPPATVKEPDTEPVTAKTEPVKTAGKKRAEQHTADKAKLSREVRARDRNGALGGRGQGSDASGAGGRNGLPGGRGQGGAASQAACLFQVAISVRRHLPASTSLGPGTANVTFYVNSGGGISGVSVSASTPAHAALARRIVASSRGPSSCAPAYASQHLTFN